MPIRKKFLIGFSLRLFFGGNMNISIEDYIKNPTGGRAKMIGEAESARILYTEKLSPTGTRKSRGPRASAFTI